MDELLSKCLLIKNAFNIDVQVFDHQFQTIFHLSSDNEPLILVEARKRIYSDLQRALEKANKNSFCFHTDSFQLSYFAVGNHEEAQVAEIILVGPFLNERVNDSFLWNIIRNNRLENTWFNPLEKFYKSLVYLGQSYLAIGDMLVNLIVNPHIDSQFIMMNNRDKRDQPLVQLEDYDRKGLDIKLRYEAEKKFLHFIETGDKESAMKALPEYTGDFLYRVPGNPLRAKKKYYLFE